MLVHKNLSNYLPSLWCQLRPFRARFSPFRSAFRATKKCLALNYKTRNFSAFNYFCLVLFARFSFISVRQYYLMFLWLCRTASQCDSTFLFYFLLVIYIELTKLPRNTSFSERLKFYFPNNEKKNVMLCLDRALHAKMS